MSPELWERIPAEAQAIYLEMVETIAGLQRRIEQWEARLGRNPQNSSLPPSREHPHAKKPIPKRKSSGRKRGGQKGHAKHQRSLVPPEQVTETITLKPSHCRRCRRTLRGVDPEPHRHQVFELPEIKPFITEYQQHRLRCPDCGVSTTAALPDGVGHGQTGPRLVAFTALLMTYFRQSKRRTALFLEALCNLPCSAALTVKLQNTTPRALRPCYEPMGQALPRSDAVARDETPTKEANHKAWLWTAVAKRFTLFRIADTRKADVAKELLGEDFSGIVTSDRYGGYDWIRNQQLCSRALAARFSEPDRRRGKSESHRPTIESVRAEVVSSLAPLPRRGDHATDHATQPP